jgi:stringent starvation protein B
MTDSHNMTSNRPYLLRAFYQWIIDNDCTPYIVVESDLPQVDVPPQVVSDGQVVLNISPSAVVGLEMDNHAVTFNARFGGVPYNLYIPNYAISAIYARENGAGTMFPPEEIPGEPEEELNSQPDLAVIDSDDESKKDKEEVISEKKKGSHLSVVK